MIQRQDIDLGTAGMSAHVGRVSGGGVDVPWEDPKDDDDQWTTKVDQFPQRSIPPSQRSRKGDHPLHPNSCHVMLRPNFFGSTHIGKVKNTVSRPSG